MADLNLIRLFDFYLAAMLLLSVYRRRKVYADGVRLFLSTFSRRKKLLGTLSAHREVLLTAEVGNGRRLSRLYRSIAFMKSVSSSE